MKTPVASKPNIQPALDSNSEEFLKLEQLESTTLCNPCKLKVIKYCTPSPEKGTSEKEMYKKYVEGLLEGRTELTIVLCKKCLKELPQCLTCARFFLNDKLFIKSYKSLVLCVRLCLNCSGSVLSDRRLYFVQPTVELTNQSVKDFLQQII